MTETIETIELIDRAEIKDGQAIVAYTRTQAAVAELRQKYQGAKYDLTTTAGDKAARAGRLELVTTRTALEKRRKELKAPAVEFGKKVDSEAARLTAELLALEAPIDAQIKADEKRREDERIAKEQAEAARRKVHTDGIAKIAGYVGQAADLPAQRIAAGIAYLEALDLAGFDDYLTEATETRARTVAALQALHAKAAAREAEAARLEAERVEQARIAAEQAETARKLKAQQDEIDRQRAEVQQREERIRADEATAQRQRDEEAARVERERLAALTHPNGAPMFSKTVIKENGDPMMLDADGKRSVFCDLDEGDDRPASTAAAPAPATVHQLPARTAAPQPAASDDEWQPPETLPKHPEQWIQVQEVALYRFAPYKANSTEAKRGIKGRWQRHNGYGFENSEPPAGPWRIGVEVSEGQAA